MACFALPFLDRIRAELQLNAQRSAGNRQVNGLSRSFASARQPNRHEKRYSEQQTGGASPLYVAVWIVTRHVRPKLNSRSSQLRSCFAVSQHAVNHRWGAAEIIRRVNQLALALVTEMRGYLRSARQFREKITPGFGGGAALGIDDSVG